MPTNPSGSPLEAALSYYSSIVTINAEGDSMVTDETLEGIGTTGFLLHALFGSILRLAQPAPPDPSPKINQPAPPTATSPTTNPSSDSTLSSRKPPISSQLKPPLDGKSSATADNGKMAAVYATQPQPAAGAIQQATGGAVRTLQAMAAGSSFGKGSSSDQGDDFLDIHDHQPQLQWREIDGECEDELTKSRLTQYLPEPGYFLAGALAGGISRTATAPLDRLKVYLLVNTKTKAGVAADVAKQGQPLAAVRTAGKPIGDAIHALWKAGGFRTFFAGR
jgi:solute carrier family 25 (mitochondrial phosphate transporter), member 23/24/25/41